MSISSGTLRLLWPVLVPPSCPSADGSRGASPVWPLRWWTGWRLWQACIIRASRIQVIEYLFNKFLNHIISAVLITGGYYSVIGGIEEEQSAEIYHPDRDSPCVITNIPESRWQHTQDDTLMCGGGDGSYTTTPRTCRKWNADTGDWDLVTESLTEGRAGHISWRPAEGAVTYIMGGWSRSGTTSEILQHDNNRVSISFTLQHNTT